MKRRTALTAAGAGVLGLGAAAAATPALAEALGAAPGRPSKRPFVRGADISGLIKNEDFGAVYRRADGRRGDAVKILAENGVNCIRAKVWVDPADGYNTKTQVVELGKRAKRAGMDLLVDFHYSDTWADPGKQYKPAAWADLSFADLKTAVYDHTADVLGALKDAGVEPGLVQVGNETNGGLLWPDGRWDQLEQMAGLLTAGCDAVADVLPKAQTILHLAEGGNSGAFQWFFDNAAANGVPFHAIGASFYPYWHGELSGLAANLNDLATRYGKPLYVVETAYPFTTSDSDGFANIMTDPEPVAGFPSSPENQSYWIEAIADVVKAVPNGLGKGLFWWEATWTGVAGAGWDPADPASGNGWENQALFDFDGKALPGLRTLGSL
ncbi:arabinogalactan endo-1,4-beta-galactosidase [Glycomyces luteolus]|uniref:Arabinogalactan endo-beta-1,4-galactanase n=1 Tax=Glycomyces luteolus TaxID=2670330 RepID=A0A9X3P618_9ACTN|nr:arabinogalactan endo-1,4-beta-galactosidase [Glycomyces luteolus]MDA1359463.1 arabinogalactan endo-1,4-beta-galactosidase [Glycomyces luteolus]